MWTLFTLLVICSVGEVAGNCWHRHGDVEEGFVFTSGCLTCTCGPDGHYVCNYPQCNVSESTNPCFRYAGGCCGECLERGCYDPRTRSLVALGNVTHPSGDPCLHCTCSPDYDEVICNYRMCARPECRHYRRVPGKCCEYRCLRGPDVISRSGGNEVV